MNIKTIKNTILITGGSSGIGLGFAQEFLKLGNKVIVCGRSLEKLNTAKKNNPELIIKQCDISLAQQREELFNWIKENHSDVNVLINNAGLQLRSGITSPEELKKVSAEVETNFIAPVHLSALFVELLKSKKESAIINISSGLAFAPLSFIPIYCATKAAIHSYTMSLRHQLKNTSVKVFEIAPPSVDTNLGHDHRGDKTQSHGGISVAEFLSEAMPAISGDIFETAVGQANGLRAKRDAMFEVMNK